MYGFCICIFYYAESRGQGRGFGHVPSLSDGETVQVIVVVAVVI
jgi:hypothetical protein